MTPAHSRCFPGAKSHQRTNDRASLSLRFCGPNPTGAQPPAPPVTTALDASAQANPTHVARRAKSHRRTADPSSFSPLSWSQISPAHERPRLVIAAPVWTKSHRHAASSTSRHLGAGCIRRSKSHWRRRRRLHPCRLRQAKSYWRTDDRYRCASVAKSQWRAASSTSRHLGAECNSAGAVTDSQCRPGYAVNSANLGTLETCHVLGGAHAVCCKLGPAVCGKLGTLETGPVLAGSSAGRPPVRPFPGQWRSHGMMQTW